MEFEKITARKNSVVQYAASFLKDGAKRREEGLFLCEGARLCRDAAISGISVELCFFTSQAKEKYGEYLDPVLAVCKKAYLIEDHIAPLLSDTKTPQGVFCLCGIPETLKSGGTADLDENCIVLENLQDPGNMGTVLRTAEALGVDSVLLSGDCCDPVSPKVLRASMGAVFRVKISAFDSREELFGILDRRGYFTHAAVPDSSARKITDVDLTLGRHAVFVGNEGSGLTPETVKMCKDAVTIPMAGRAESLNASAAATVLLWEMCRGRERDREKE